MKRRRSMSAWFLCLGLALAVLLAAGCAGLSRNGPLRLSGNQEVPPVATSSSATTNIVVQQTKCPSSATSLSCPEILGSVYTAGVSGTSADIRQGRRGQNGPAVVTLMKVNDTTWAIPPFTFLSDGQYEAYEAGDLYVNVRSLAHPNGEIRAQLVP
jgi:CHRD domain-containing protein